MPGLVKRRFPVAEGLRYDSSSDTLYLMEGFRGVDPIVAVRNVIGTSNIVQLNDVQAFDSIQLSGPSIVKGSLLAGVEVTLKAYGPILVVGDIGTASRSLKEGLRNRVAVEGDGNAYVTVLGSILSREVTVNAPTIVVGDVLGLEKVEINSPTLVLGRVISGTEEKRGSVYLKNTTAYQVYATGNISIDDGTSVFLPLIAAKKGKINLKAEKVRVISFPCIYCAATSEPLLCENYLQGSCPAPGAEEGYDYLYGEDYSEADGYSLLSWYWRSSPLMIVQNILSKKLLYSALEIKRNLHIDPAKMEINNIPLAEYHRHVLSQLLSNIRSKTEEAVVDARKAVFNVVEEYFKANNIEYVKCPHCGAPNPADTKICMYCGEQLK